MAQVITDDFNRASLGSNYLLIQGTAMVIQASARLQPNDTGLSHSTLVQTANPWARNHYAKVTLTSVDMSNYCGIAVRSDPNGTATMYFFHCSGFDGTVGKFVDGTYTSFSNATAYAAVNGDVIELRIENALVTAKKNGSVVFQTTDYSIITGNPGVHGYTQSTGSSSTAADSWEGGDIITSQGDPMYVPFAGHDFGWTISNHTGRPAGAEGVALTPGNNSKGSWAQLFTALSNDVYWIKIVINSGSTSAAARDILIDIGIDEAGGTSYSVLINNLIGSCANSIDVGGGITYYFPIFIKAGSTVGARASVNNATVGTVRVFMRVWGRPRNPEMVKVGSYVLTLGATTASSNGTAVTPGTTSEGAWTSIGTLSAPAWWFQAGVGVNDSTMAAVVNELDVAAGDATNKDIIIDTQRWTSDASERHANEAAVQGCERYVPSGTNIYARLQCSGTPDSNMSVAVYAVGG